MRPGLTTYPEWHLMTMEGYPGPRGPMPFPDLPAVTDFGMDQENVKDLLDATRREDRAAWDRLMALVYEDLKRIAHGQMSRIAPGQTLSTTVLVHETFEKLAISRSLPVHDRTAFYALCASAMRQIIIDHYRKRSAGKRDPGPGRDVLAEHESQRANPEGDRALTALGSVLGQLLRRDERLVRVFEMRYFAGLSDIEIAARLELSPRSVQRLAMQARAWIVSALEE